MKSELLSEGAFRTDRTWHLILHVLIPSWSATHVCIHVWAGLSVLICWTMKPRFKTRLGESGIFTAEHSSTEPSCPINDQHTAPNPFLYTLLLWGLRPFSPPLIQLLWKTIMRFRHCLLFNYRTYLSFSNMQRLAFQPFLYMAQKFQHSVEIIVMGNWINMTEGVVHHGA